MKTWLLVLITVIVTGGAVGGGIYYYLDQNSDKDIAALQTQLDALKKPAATTVVDSTADWKTYTSTKYGFSAKYPKDWTVVDSADNNVSFRSADTAAKFKEIADSNIAVGGPTSDMVVAYYPTIKDADVNAVKSAKTIADLANDKGAARSGATKITFAGGEAYEDIMAGMTSVYEILAGNNNHVYSLTFNVETKAELTATQKLIISNFTFTK